MNQNSAAKQSILSKLSRYLLLAIIACFFFLLLQFIGERFLPSRKVIGAQIVSNKGTLLIARNKYSKQLMLWHSPYFGHFQDNGQGDFFFVRQENSREGDANWQLSWQWDELYRVGDAKALYSLEPSKQEKNSSKETLSKLCKEPSSNPNVCQWQLERSISVEAVTQKQLCLSRFSSSYYGGAHPLLGQEFGSLDVKSKAFNTLESFFPDQKQRKLLWQKLGASVRQNWPDETEDLGSSSLMLGLSDGNGKDASPSNSVMLDAEPEKELQHLLSAQAHEFEKDNFCPSFTASGPGLLFAFVSAEEANKGIYQKLWVALSEREFRMSKKLKAEFPRHKSQNAGAKSTAWLEKLISPDKSWSLEKSLDGKMTVQHESGEKVAFWLPDNSEKDEEQLLGIFWMHRSPSLADLQKMKFRELKGAADAKEPVYIDQKN